MFKFKVNVSAVFKFKVEGLDSLVKFRPLPLSPPLHITTVFLLLSRDICEEYCVKIQFNSVSYVCAVKGF